MDTSRQLPTHGDAHAGLVRAVSECLPGAGRQRHVARLERDACSLLCLVKPDFRF